MLTNNEATQFLAISDKYLEREKLVELFTRWDDEIGKTTENEAFKQTLAALRSMVTPVYKKPPFYLWWTFYALVGFHLILVFAIIAAFIVLPFVANWYIALPLMTFIFFFSTTKVECQMTNAENYLRQRLGMKKIGGFVGHYLWRPSKRLYRRFA